MKRIQHFLLCSMMLCCCTLHWLNAQTQDPAQRIRRALQQEKVVSRKAGLYLQLYNEFRRAQFDSSLAVAKELVVYSEQNNYPGGYINGQLRLAIELTRQGDFAGAYAQLEKAKTNLAAHPDHEQEAYAWAAAANILVTTGKSAEALAACDKGFNIAAATKDTLNLIFIYDTRAKIYFNLGSAVDMQESAIQALALAQKAHLPKQECMAHRALAMMYLVFQTGDSVTFLNHTQRCIELARLYNCPYDEAEALTQMSAYYRTNTHYDQALDYAFQSVEKMKKIGSPGRYAAILSGVGYVYLSMEKPDDALGWFNQAIAVMKQKGDLLNLVITYRGIGTSLLHAGKAQEGMAFMQQAYDICNESNFNEKKLDIIEEMIGHYKGRGEYLLAYYLLKEYQTFHDSIFSIHNAEQIGKLQSKFEFQKKEDSLLFINKLGIQERERQDLLLLARQNDLLVAQQFGRIQSLSLLQKDDSLARQKLALQIEQSDNAAKLAIAEKAQQAAVQQRRTWVGILAGLLAVAILLLLVFRSRSHIQQLRLHHQMTTSEMKALRAQMSPHFLFNALNSINATVLNGNTYKANEQIGQFSQLMRRILEHSRQNIVPLADELQLAELYLQIEQQRFNPPFDYCISVAKDIDADDEPIPTMILQPFIENAIWHGLQYLPPGERKGNIHIQVAKEQHQLHCTVEDNGMGRKYAECMRGKHHQSKGLDIIGERLRLLPGNNRMHITDLYDGDTAAGTRVDLWLEA